MVGIWCTLGASAGYALLLCLMQLSLERVLKRETFSVVLEMQIWTSLVASCVCIVGLFSSGEGKGLEDEMRRFKAGRYRRSPIVSIKLSPAKRIPKRK